MPVGWGNTYLQSVAGQAFDITGVPNGTYYIEITANPQHVLYESNTRNDLSLRKVILGGTPGRCRSSRERGAEFRARILVLCAPGGGQTIASTLGRMGPRGRQGVPRQAAAAVRRMRPGNHERRLRARRLA